MKIFCDLFGYVTVEVNSRQAAQITLAFCGRAKELAFCVYLSWLSSRGSRQCKICKLVSDDFSHSFRRALEEEVEAEVKADVDVDADGDVNVNGRIGLIVRDGETER